MNRTTWQCLGVSLLIAGPVCFLLPFRFAEVFLDPNITVLPVLFCIMVAGGLTAIIGGGIIVMDWNRYPPLKVEFLRRYVFADKKGWIWALVRPSDDIVVKSSGRMRFSSSKLAHDECREWHERNDVGVYYIGFDHEPPASNPNWA